jgi:lipid-binding SYLF domain-containing protein
MVRMLLVALLVFAVDPLLAAPPTAGDTLRHAKIVLDELEEVPAKGLPKALLLDAEAIVIVPNTVKAGFVVGGRVGHGVAVMKTKDGWGDIRFLTFGGASIGFQAGVQVTDVVLVFKTRRGLDRMLEGKTKLTLGADASVAAGPVGRDARVATDGKLQAEIWSYSRSRGLFAGIALDGAVLAADADTNRNFVKDSGPETLKSADQLKMKIAGMAMEKKLAPLPPAFKPETPGRAPDTIPTIPSDLPPAFVPTIPPPPAPPSSIIPYVPAPATRQPLFPNIRKLFGRGE